MTELDNFYLNLQEPDRSCFIALREYILSIDDSITPEWKYKLPFFYYKGKMLCYFWIHKKLKQPYIGFMDGNLIEHPYLVKEDRARVQILLVDAEKDIPIDTVSYLVLEAIRILEKTKKY